LILFIIGKASRLWLYVDPTSQSSHTRDAIDKVGPPHEDNWAGVEITKTDSGGLSEKEKRKGRLLREKSIMHVNAYAGLQGKHVVHRYEGFCGFFGLGGGGSRRESGISKFKHKISMHLGRFG
jgi:hypothetical protein